MIDSFGVALDNFHIEMLFSKIMTDAGHLKMIKANAKWVYCLGRNIPYNYALLMVTLSHMLTNGLA
jgi:hypothetical protein